MVRMCAWELWSCFSRFRFLLNDLISILMYFLLLLLLAQHVPCFCVVYWDPIRGRSIKYSRQQSRRNWCESDHVRLKIHCIAVSLDCVPRDQAYHIFIVGACRWESEYFSFYVLPVHITREWNGRYSEDIRCRNIGLIFGRARPRPREIQMHDPSTSISWLCNKWRDTDDPSAVFLCPWFNTICSESGSIPSPKNIEVSWKAYNYNIPSL